MDPLSHTTQPERKNGEETSRGGGEIDKETCRDGDMEKGESSATALGLPDKPLAGTTAKTIASPARVPKRKVFVIEYECIGSAYVVPMKKPKLGEASKDSPYMQSQRFWRREFPLEKRRKLAFPEPKMRELSTSYFEQLEWLIQLEEDEIVEELDLDGPYQAASDGYEGGGGDATSDDSEEDESDEA